MKLRYLTLMVAAAALLTLAACKKKVPVAKATPPTPTTTASNPPAERPVRRTPSTPTTVAENTPRSRMPDAATKARIQDLLDRIQDAYFDYDKHNIRPDAQKTLTDDAHTLAEILKDYPEYKLTVEGYCDERGSEEYNLALGDARAKQAKDYLVTLGIPGNQLRTVSYGKDKPVCTDSTESCWQKNRRAHITQEQG